MSNASHQILRKQHIVIIGATFIKNVTSMFSLLLYSLHLGQWDYNGKMVNIAFRSLTAVVCQLCVFWHVCMCACRGELNMEGQRALHK